MQSVFVVLLGHPAWWLNLEAHPRAIVRLAHEDPRPVRARLAHGEERERLWGLFPDGRPFVAHRKTETAIVVLEPR